jgi:signal transduction histidine kinase/CheY-like chemotaxis protein
MVGLTADESFEGIKLQYFHSAEELSRIHSEVFPRIMKEKTAIRENIIFLDQQQQEIPTSCIVMIELDENERVSHYMFTARDLREEKLAQSKLEHAQRLESLGVLAGGIAHDFNNILTGILGNAALASNKLGPNAPIAPYLKNIESGSQRAAELCKQMLAYSGKGKFIVTMIDMNQMLDEITRLMEVSIHKNVVLKFHLNENLPMVEADKAQLQQVMMNLIINASEAIDGNSGVVSLSTGVMFADRNYLRSTAIDGDVALPGQYAYLEVSDTGCGMDEKTQKNIFDPFFTTKFTGRGLGMSAVLGIVRGHKGAIKCYSEKGKGTTFKVLLPCKEGSIPELTEQKNLQKIASKCSGTALIVDDEETILEIAGMILEEMGFELLKASDGQQGVELFQQHHEAIALVLLDMTMPKMDGVEAFREMQRIDPKVKVILSSGYNEQDATNRFAGKGLAGFIQKPYLPNALQQIVRDNLT